jgi:hypothetical protein
LCYTNYQILHELNQTNPRIITCVASHKITNMNDACLCLCHANAMQLRTKHLKCYNFLPPCRISTMSNFFHHVGLINISTMPALPRNAGIFSNFSRHAGTITKFVLSCEIIPLKGHKCQDWLIFNH